MSNSPGPVSETESHPNSNSAAPPPIQSSLKAERHSDHSERKACGETLHDETSIPIRTNLEPQPCTEHSVKDTCEELLETEITISKGALPIGKWRCCECQRGHGIYRFETGQHLVSILSCMCKHHSCTSCILQGNVKRFAPIDDGGVAYVPVSGETGPTIRFGVICRTCGLSWRAKKTKKAKRSGAMSSFRQKLSVLPKKVNSLHKLRHTQLMIHIGFARDSHPEHSRSGTSLSTSRSIFNLRAADTQAKSAEPEEQIEGARVKLYGVECTCSTVTSVHSLCFQVIDTPEDDNDTVSKEQVSIESVQAAEHQTTPELQAKGHGTSTLYLMGGLIKIPS